jgi:mRNA-degrading endonuclease YafQ of YafQ-DinJ toxin-antitoxin module
VLYVGAGVRRRDCEKEGRGHYHDSEYKVVKQNFRQRKRKQRAQNREHKHEGAWRRAFALQPEVDYKVVYQAVRLYLDVFRVQTPYVQIPVIADFTAVCQLARFPRAELANPYQFVQQRLIKDFETNYKREPNKKARRYHYRRAEIVL